MPNYKQDLIEQFLSNTDCFSNNNYTKYFDGYWVKREHNSNSNFMCQEKSNGYWSKIKYDINGNIIYCEDSNSYWIEVKYASNGIYYETNLR